MNRLTQVEQAASMQLRSSTASQVFICGSLLFPLLAAGNFALCTLLIDAAFTGHDYLFSVMTFLLTNLIIDTPPIRLGRQPQARFEEFTYIGLRWALVTILTIGLMELGGVPVNVQDGALWAWAASTPLLLWVAYVGLQRAVVEHAAATHETRKAVIVGVSEVGMRLEAIINGLPSLGVRVTGFFEDRSSNRIPASATDRVLGRSCDVAAYVRETGVHAVYITLPMSRQQRVKDLLESLRDSTVSVYFVPDMLVCNLIQARIDTLGGLPLIAVCESPFYGLRGLLKRATDILFATMLLVVSLPLLAFAALGVKVTSPGPILFRQKRYGLDGQPIMVYKFRSMRVTEDGDQVYRQVARGDSRVTPFGAFLRKTSMDELPQLLNVLEGSMSLVGPRPHVIAVNEQFRRLIPGYMLRHKVRPGITGWAQVNGYRGGDDLESMTKRIECDLEYLKCWSLRLDLKIILRTVLLVFGDRDAY